MPKIITISGSFTRRGEPIGGMVRFIPGRLWVIVDSVPWACLAPEVTLDADGRFMAGLTATDSDPIWWTYRAETPAGIYDLWVPGSSSRYSLKDLVREYRPWPRSSH